MAGNLYGYDPSPVAAILFVLLFGISTIWHAVIMFRRRTWYFTVLIIGGCLEIAGYVCRFLSHNDTSNLSPFIVQTLTILVAPALFAASIYMVLGRLILLLRAEGYSPIRPSLLTKVFVGGDLVCFLVQIIGSGQLSSNFNLAKTIILVGLVAQLLFFGLFVVVATVVHRRLARRPTPTALRLDELNAKMGWRGVTRVIYLASALIFVRSVFRVVEFAGGHDSPVMKSEAFLYLCDSTLMFSVLAILIYYHPAEYVPNRKEILQMNGEELA